MNEIEISADNLVGKLLKLSESEQVCFLDSCGQNQRDSHLLIAGVRPVRSISFLGGNPEETLAEFDTRLSDFKLASIFTISYDFGVALQRLDRRKKKWKNPNEPEIFLAQFECLIIHDYLTGTTRLEGRKKARLEIADLISKAECYQGGVPAGKTQVSSNFSEREYLKTIEAIRELIRDGETYQVNLTQQVRAKLPSGLSPRQIFNSLRDDHPAPYAAFLKRNDDFVVSISPERFLTVSDNRIKVSPIKGTRPRGKTKDADQKLRDELLDSAKDRAENTMIVDLLRNDIGRVCKYGSIEVEQLCELSEHASLFHLVSTISGTLRKHVSYSDIIRAVFPCGSITGCPKIRTMEIIDRLETADRGLSMGAIGYLGFDHVFDLNVAIRTLVIRGNCAVFNIGGGIVVDSDSTDEYQESILKGRAILNSLNANGAFKT